MNVLLTSSLVLKWNDELILNVTANDIRRIANRVSEQVGKTIEQKRAQFQQQNSTDSFLAPRQAPSVDKVPTINRVEEKFEKYFGYLARCEGKFWYIDPAK